MSLYDFLLGAVPDAAEILNGLGVGPFHCREITSDGSVLFNQVAEALDTMFGQPIRVDVDVGQEATESLDLVERFLEAIFSGDCPSGEARGSGSHQELNASA